jgi:hypothetical protein
MHDFSESLGDPWSKTWKALSRLTGLRRLHIDLVFRYTHPDEFEEYWKDKGTKLLEPVKLITWPRDFVVTLPDARCTTNVDVGKSRCVFEVKREEAVITETIN